MARIPESEIERLKSEVSVERLAEARGVKLTRKGADLHGRCCFHEDRTPSLVITPETNLWHCLGACQEGGTVIDWVMKAEGVSFRHAVELLRADLPSLAAASSPAPRAVKRSTVRKLPDLADASEEDQQLLLRVVDHYHQALKQSPEALEYLQGRGLTSSEMLAHFRIGYANRTLGYRLPDATRKEGAAIRGRLKDLGVLRGSGHEHLSGSIVIPLLDAKGQVVQMYGRKVRSDLRKGTATHLYLPGPQRGVFNREGLAAGPEVILCESLIDALTFWCAGFRNVTTTYGTSGIPKDLWAALEDAGTKRVLIAFDRDEAGDKAAAKVAKELQAAGMAAYRVLFPKGMDANEYALKVQPAEKSLGVVLRHAPWLGEGQAPARDLEATPEAAPEDEDLAAAPPAQDLMVPTGPPPAAAPVPVPPPAPTRSAEATTPLAPAKQEPPPLPEAPPPETPHRIPLPEPGVALERRGEDLWMHRGERSYRVRGLSKNLSFEGLKVNLLATREKESMPAGTAGFHVDTLDLYAARHRHGFLKLAAVELGVEEETIKRDLGELLLLLEAVQEEEIQKRLGPRETAVELTADDQADALELLRSPELLREILADFERCGVVGEETNKLVGYLAAVSRKLEKPLAIVVQSNSAAGKSSLMDAVLAFMPEEEQVSYSAMTGQALFYMSGTDLRHKILAIAEEEGAQRASYALKLLQSEGQLTIASTGKDPVSGRLTTEDYRVEGPVMLFLTTTATDVDEELMNRCMVLAVDEGRAQTEAIHRQQREGHTLAGKLRKRERDATLKRHRNAQRLLKPILVDNPYARSLTFQGHQTRFRRDHEKYLNLIESIALLHQYQREKKEVRVGGEVVAYIEVQPSDIATANRLAHEVLGRSVDELPPQTRIFLRSVVAMVEERVKKDGIGRREVRFTRREVREWTGTGNNRVHVHLERLEDLEYVLIHSGSRGKSLVYELVYEGTSDQDVPFFPGLLEVDALGEGCRYDGNLSGLDPHLSGQEAEFSGPIRPLFAPSSGGIRGGVESPEILSESSFSSSLEAKSPEFPENARSRAKNSRLQVVPANGTKPPRAE